MLKENNKTTVHSDGSTCTASRALVRTEPAHHAAARLACNAHARFLAALAVRGRNFFFENLSTAYPARL